jgi:hypothetical protein
MRALDLLISYAHSRGMHVLVMPEGESTCVAILDVHGMPHGSVSASTMEAACEALLGILPVHYEVPDTLPPEWAA